MTTRVMTLSALACLTVALVSCAPALPVPISTLPLEPSASPIPASTSAPTAPPIARSAELSELTNEVHARTTASETWQAADDGAQLAVGGGAKTGDEARARLDIFPDKTIIRLAAHTEFELLALSPEAADPVTRFLLSAGKVWLLVTTPLGAGSFEIETPSGSAGVRGSLMSVEYDPVTGTLTVTCLDGQCHLTGTSGQTTNLTRGEQSEIVGPRQNPTPAHPMHAAELVEWAAEVPEAQPVVAVVAAALAPSPTPTPAVTPTPTEIPGPNASVSSEGTVEASSIFSADYPAVLAVDGSRATSWFSAGSNVDGAASVFRWTGVRDDLITSMLVLSNRDHSEPSVRTGFGFEKLTVQILNAAGAVVYEQSVSLDGTPDPDVSLKPGVVGRSVVLIFSGHEDPTCGGFSELQIGVTR